MAIFIGGMEFKTKESCKRYFFDILNSASIGEDVSDKLLNELYFRHRKHRQYIAYNFRHVYVDYDGFGGRCFYAAYSDKNDESFSVMKCINNAKNYATENFSDACRSCIYHQIVLYRASKRTLDNKYISELSGKEFDYGSIHVDHVKPFVDIVNDFILINCIDVNTVCYETSNGGLREFIDNKLHKDFYNYHLKNAELRILSCTENLTRKRSSSI